MDGPDVYRVQCIRKLDCLPPIEHSTAAKVVKAGSQHGLEVVGGRSSCQSPFPLLQHPTATLPSSSFSCRTLASHLTFLRSDELPTLEVGGGYRCASSLPPVTSLEEHQIIAEVAIAAQCGR